MLWCATPDSVARLSTKTLKTESVFISDVYFKEQQHESLSDYLYHRWQHSETSIFAQVESYNSFQSTLIQFS